MTFSSADIYGLNTRNCINGMVLSGDIQVSWVTTWVFGCHQIDDKSYEFLI